MARPRQITDQAMKDAARDVFVEHGPGASVALVAKKLGVSHAAVFSRVGSKQRLMQDALRPGRPVAFDQLEEPPPAQGVEARLIDVLEELMVFFQRIVPNLVVLKASGALTAERPSTGEPPPPVALRQALTRWLEQAIEGGTIRPVHAPSVAEGLLGAMEARCFNAFFGGRTYAAGDDPAFVRELVHGLLGTTQESR